MKQQVVFINGGNPKENYDSYTDFLQGLEYNPYEENFLSWNKTLWKYLWEDYEYLTVPFREKKYADYNEWKIMFEKLLPFLREEVVLVSTSLWSSFILKYIGEKEFPVPIKKIFFVAPALDDTPDELLGTFRFDLEMIYHKVQRWAKDIYIYHSRDDNCVPFEQSLTLKSFFPEAVFREFDDRGHFYAQERLPEIERDIMS